MQKATSCCGKSGCEEPYCGKWTTVAHGVVGEPGVSSKPIGQGGQPLAKIKFVDAKDMPKREDKPERTQTAKVDVPVEAPSEITIVPAGMAGAAGASTPPQLR